MWFTFALNENYVIANGLGATDLKKSSDWLLHLLAIKYINLIIKINTNKESVELIFSFIGEGFIEKWVDALRFKTHFTYSKVKMSRKNYHHNC